jgi:predicted NodU family carbamoyl transferase
MSSIEVVTVNQNYKEIFENLIENLNDSQLNELIEEINIQKQLLKVSEIKRKKMKAEIRQEKIQLTKEIKEMKEKILKEYQEKLKKHEEEEELELELIEKKTKKPIKKKY